MPSISKKLFYSAFEKYTLLKMHVAYCRGLKKFRINRWRSQVELSTELEAAYIQARYLTFTINN